MKVEIIKSGYSIKGGGWIVVQKCIQNVKLHTSLYVDLDLADKVGIEFEIPKSLNDKNHWTKSGKSIFIKAVCEYEIGPYRLSLTSVFSFGLYNGIEVGIVYAFDIKYIEWCILNVDNFVIVDLFILQDIGIIEGPKKYAVHRNTTPEMLSFMYEFKSILILAKEVPVLNPEYRLETKIYLMNQLRI
jgi:hypothetical protein